MRIDMHFYSLKEVPMLVVIRYLHFQDTRNDIVKDESDNILGGIDRFEQ
jgi:hypothetical protein